MGILAESIEEAKEAIKTHKLELSNSLRKGKELEAELEKERGKAKDIKDTEEASRKAKEIRELEVRIKSNQQSPKEYEIKIHNAEQAMRDAEEIYRKYEKLSNPDYFQRQDALKDLQALFDKYPENDPNKKVISVARRNFTATEEKLTDPYDFAGKTRRQQAEAMLKTLKEQLPRILASRIHPLHTRHSLQQSVCLKDRISFSRLHATPILQVR